VGHDVAQFAAFYRQHPRSAKGSLNPEPQEILKDKAFLPIYLSNYLSIYQTIYLSTYLSIYLPKAVSNRNLNVLKSDGTPLVAGQSFLTYLSLR
jgi:hypothetical protein